MNDDDDNNEWNVEEKSEKKCARDIHKRAAFVCSNVSFVAVLIFAVFFLFYTYILFVHSDFGSFWNVKRCTFPNIQVFCWRHRSAYANCYKINKQMMDLCYSFFILVWIFNTAIGLTRWLELTRTNASVLLLHSFEPHLNELKCRECVLLARIRIQNASAIVCDGTIYIFCFSCF